MTELRDNIFAIEYVDECYHQVYADIKDNYEILCDTKEVTEGQAASIVEKLPPAYSVFKCYEKEWRGYHTATESLQSLLKSKGLTAGNYLIIKKVAS